MDRLDMMRTFCRVAELSSFSRAARQLGLSAPVVSRQVSALEGHLGIRLLNRSTRQVELTEAGSRYYDSCVVLLEQLEAAEARVSSLGSRPSGCLRIAVPLDFGQLFLQPVIREYLSKEPEVRLEVFFEDRQVHLLDEHFDVAIRVGQLADSSLVSRKLGEACIACYASPDYLAAHGKPAEPEALVNYQMLDFALSRTPGRWSFNRNGENLSIETTGRLSANNGRVLAQAACRGLGIVRLPEFLVQDHIANGELIEILEPFRSPPLDVSVIYLQRKFNPAKISSFTDFLVERMGQNPGWMPRTG